MPRRLVARCQPDSIDEFRASAQQRWTDAVRLIQVDRGTAAIYFSGYVVEMLLKAAYFELIGYQFRQPIRLPDLNAAKVSATVLE